MIELHLGEKLWEYLVNRSVKDYGLFILIVSLLFYLFIEYGIINLITLPVLYITAVIGFVIVTIGSIRDATTIDISNNHHQTTKAPKKHIFTGIQQINVKFPFEPISINIVIKQLSRWKRAFVSYFMKSFDLTLEFSYPKNIFDIRIPPLFEEIIQNQSDCQKRIKMDDTIKNDTCTIPISIAPRRMEQKTTITIKMSGIAKQGGRLRSIFNSIIMKPLLIILLSWETAFIVIENN